MSWISNYIYGDYSDDTVVPDSYETFISGSWAQLMSTTREHEEVVSGIRHRDNTVQFDLNIPVDDTYDYGYSYGDRGESSFVKQDYGYNAVQLDLNIPYGDGGEPSYKAEGSYPIMVSFETDQVFNSREDLVDWVKNRGIEHGYVIN